MSDQKKYEQIMSKHMEGQFRQDMYRQHDPRAAQHFTRPANRCELCGHPMNLDPQTQQQREITVWERKWSIHRVCAESMQNQLDRQSGILSERSGN